EDDHRYPEQRQEHQEEAPHQVSTQGLYPFIRTAADRICRASWRFANTPRGRGLVRLNGTAAAGGRVGPHVRSSKHARAPFESMIEPDVLEAPAVVRAVGHDRDPLHPR